MSITFDAPTAEIPAVPTPVAQAERIVETVLATQKERDIAYVVRDAAVAEAAKQVAANDGLRAVLDQRNAELAAAGLQIAHLEAHVAALAASCHARQTALTDPSVREAALERQIASDRAYARWLEAEYETQAREVQRLRGCLALAPGETATPPVGRRRRTR